MSQSEDFDFNANKKERSVYSIHLDKGRLAVIAMVILFLISGTFFIGLFVGESKEKVYDSNTYRLNDKNSLSQKSDSMEPDLSKGLVDKGEKSYGLDLVEPRTVNTLVEEKKLVPHLGNENGSGELKAFAPEKKTQVHAGEKTIAVSKEQKEKKAHKKVLKAKNKTDVVGASHKVKPTKKDNQKSFAVISGYQIQVASFSELKRARLIRKKLAQKGFKGHIASKELANGTTSYRVTVGAGSKMADLEKQLKELRKMEAFKSSFIVKM